MIEASSRGLAQGYVPGLDGIRAVAVLLVLAFHAQVPVLTGGYIGVDIFFVLSGYLISTLLLQEVDRTGTVDMWAFWRRRIVRLFPAMLLLVVAYMCAARWIAQSPLEAFWHPLAGLIYMADYFQALAGQPLYLGHLWSLAVEAKFYLVWPFILVLWARTMAPGTLARAVALSALAASAWRIMNVQIGLSWDLVYYRFDTRLSGLLIGSALAAAQRADFNPKVPAWAGFLPLALVPLLSRHFGHFDMLTWAPLAFELATALVILVVLRGHGPIAQALACRPMVWLGTLSYGIYLWHYPIMRLLRDADLHWAAMLTGGALLSIGLSWMSMHTVERWAKRYRAAPPALKSATA